jgi:hypothetical protein
VRLTARALPPNLLGEKGLAPSSPPDEVFQAAVGEPRAAGYYDSLVDNGHVVLIDASADSPNRFERAKMLWRGHKQRSGLRVICDETLCFAPV